MLSQPSRNTINQVTNLPSLLPNSRCGHFISFWFSWDQPLPQKPPIPQHPPIEEGCWVLGRMQEYHVMGSAMGGRDALARPGCGKGLQSIMQGDNKVSPQVGFIPCPPKGQNTDQHELFSGWTVTQKLQFNIFDFSNYLCLILHLAFLGKVIRRLYVLDNHYLNLLPMNKQPQIFLSVILSVPVSLKREEK